MAGKKEDANQRRRAKRLAERAERFERHAALVNQRADDRRFVQRVTDAQGRVTVTLAESEGPQITDALRQQQELFRDKFGREMGPSDPVFFDPDADEPVPVDEGKMMAEIRQEAERMPDPQMRAYLLAFAECGYMVTEANQHTFSAHEAEAFTDAVERHLD
ncbi:hypothetical protein [Actinomadura rubrisoli]|uniref:Uncharacterized protein n=1 Tax=Actinomadura rubrisoli TaxID=2530368 RepID=A0A4R5B2V5_9ACTN|nr:hypothetical protein [Actinomadura rubrisoli]TDD79049.1 hypothetical protein E1298_28640 [Actinomadura rubrisoli]